LKDGDKLADAVTVLRRALAAEKDSSVVIAQVGFSSNLAALLASAPDSASPLPGVKLVAQKVKLLSAMAGHFPKGSPEYNVKIDIPAAKKIVAEWPTPVVFSGFEIGQDLLFPAASIEHDFAWVGNHPVADAYRAYKAMPYDRPTWDLTAVLYGIRPDRKYFSLSPSGRVTIDDKGETTFTATADGQHRYLILAPEQKSRALETLILLSTQPL
jgi:inosine-uridine nucleoside N-ribohydrolase